MKVGLFFVVNEKVLAEMIDITTASIYGDFLIGNVGHYDVWEAKYRKIYCKEYDYFPRGRVVLNNASKEYIIYFDRCISKTKRNEIVEIFDLKEQQVKFEKDQHYVCRRCNRNYIDL